MKKQNNIYYVFTFIGEISSVSERDMLIKVAERIFTNNPLKDYLESLKEVKKLDIELLLSEHGASVDDMYKWIN